MLIAATLLAGKDGAPAPLAPVPASRQIEWQRTERYCFVHFGPNTFTGEEWGHGTEDPKIFNPKHLDCDQWVKSMKDAGFKGVIITAKHHDGFCLWPSKYSTHTVAQSLWKGGKGDVLKELSVACRKAQFKMGVYLSPWDRNHPSYGTAEYNQTFAHMLEEVLTKYGPMFEVWFDGANGEGPNGKKQVYDWPLFIGVVRKYQPKAVIFSDAGPDIRWVGNEGGIAGETSWSNLNRDQYFPGTPRYAELTEGQENGTNWVAPECDVSIRPGWFWRATENSKVKSVDQLREIYYASVGRNSSMLLNVPPNSDGLISIEDVTRLKEFDQSIKSDVAHPLKPERVEADSAFGKDHWADKATDGNSESYWAAKDGATSATLSLDYGKTVTFNMIVLSEFIPLGQRVKKFHIEVDGGQVVASGTTIGNKRILRINPTSARRVKVVIEDSRAAPILSEVKLYSPDN